MLPLQISPDRVLEEVRDFGVMLNHGLRTLSELGRIVGSEQDPVAGARRMAERLEELEEQTRRAGSADLSKKAEEIAALGHKVGGITVFVGRGEDADQRSLLDLADRSQADDVLRRGGQSR